MCIYIYLQHQLRQTSGLSTLNDLHSTHPTPPLSPSSVARGKVRVRMKSRAGCGVAGSRSTHARHTPVPSCCKRHRCEARILVVVRDGRTSLLFILNTMEIFKIVTQQSYMAEELLTLRVCGIRIIGCPSSSINPPSLDRESMTRKCGRFKFKFITARRCLSVGNQEDVFYSNPGISLSIL